MDWYKTQNYTYLSKITQKSISNPTHPCYFEEQKEFILTTLNLYHERFSMLYNYQIESLNWESRQYQEISDNLNKIISIFQIIFHHKI